MFLLVRFKALSNSKLALTWLFEMHFCIKLQNNNCFRIIIIIIVVIYFFAKNTNTCMYPYANSVHTTQLLSNF